MGDPKKAAAVDCLMLPGESGSQAMARLMVDPHMRNAYAADLFNAPMFKGHEPDIGDVIAETGKISAGIASGNLKFVSDTLTMQAMTLDAIFTDCARQAFSNKGEYPKAYDRYMALAMKAQSNCRTTLEVLARLHQPREQVVRHVHVYEGGQAVVAEEFHHHAKGAGNAEFAHQAHTPARPATGGATLPSPNPIGQSMPSAEGARSPQVSDARRGKGKRGTTRKSERIQARPSIVKDTVHRDHSAGA
jgi:hypothetical protein